MDVDNKRVEGFGGMFGFEDAKKTKLCLPRKIEKGLLYINTNKKILLC